LVMQGFANCLIEAPDRDNTAASIGPSSNEI
jgi:hypothetical protein